MCRMLLCHPIAAAGVQWPTALPLCRPRRPWCDPANKLVLAFGLLPANASASTAEGLVVESGAEVKERWEQQQDLLTGAADPGAVPVPDAGSGDGSAAAPPPDPAVAGAAGRRLMARRGGGFKFGGSSKAPTRPTSNPPTSGSSSASGTTPVSVAPSSTGGKPYRPYFPAGGASRPRFPTTAAAVGTLPFAAAQRPYLASRYYYNRPVYGFGRWVGAGDQSGRMQCPVMQCRVGAMHAGGWPLATHLLQAPLPALLHLSVPPAALH